MSKLEHLSKRLEEYQEAANKAVVVELKARRAKQDVRAVRDRLFDGLAQAYGRLDDALSGLYRTLPATDRAELDGLLQRCKPQLSSTHPDRPILDHAALNRLSRSLHRITAADACSESIPEDGDRRDNARTQSSLAEALQVDSETIRRYANLARVPRAGSGKKNHKYSSAEVLAILQKMVHGGARRTRESARELLNTLNRQ